jgi:hypothetical protein
MRITHTLLLLAATAAGQLGAAEGYTDTPLVPGQKWHVHDSTRPQPVVVTPGTGSTAEQPGKPPSDAIVLFDGKDASQWKTAWKVEDGAMVAGGGDNFTKEEDFGDIQLHLEWAEPTPAKGNGQGRGNSGVFFFGRYELQVLDCYENQTYPDGQTSAIYGSWPPLVNACRPPGEWQTYDIAFTAPKFKGEELVTPAFITVFHNGVLTQNHTQYNGDTNHKQAAAYHAHAPTGPLKLQDHGNPVRYRNIWVRKLVDRGDN